MIGIAAVFGAASIFAADIWVKSAANARVQEVTVTVPAPAKPEVAFKTIVVANAPLSFGMPLDRAQLSEIPWPQEALPEGAFATIDELIEQDRVVLSPVAVNEPVLLAKLSGPNGRASLSNLLTPGMRAVTIKTDEIAGVGGFVTPGDRVDVVLTRDAGAIEEVASNAKGASGSTIASETVLENVKVLSVGQGADVSNTDPRVASSVTLEVTAEGAQKVALARNIGNLSLSLRSAGEAGGVAPNVTTISAFGGSALSEAAASAGALFDAATSEPEAPKFKTVIVTRGLEAQSYQVVTPQGSNSIQQD